MTSSFLSTSAAWVSGVSWFTSTPAAGGSARSQLHAFPSCRPAAASSVASERRGGSGRDYCNRIARRSAAPVAPGGSFRYLLSWAFSVGWHRAPRWQNPEWPPVDTTSARKRLRRVGRISVSAGRTGRSGGMRRRACGRKTRRGSPNDGCGDDVTDVIRRREVLERQTARFPFADGLRGVVGISEMEAHQKCARPVTGTAQIAFAPGRRCCPG